MVENKQGSKDLAVLEAYVASQPEPKSREAYGKLQADGMKMVNAARQQGFVIAEEIEDKQFTETFKAYRSALYGVSTALSLAHTLLHNEIARLPPLSRPWEALAGMANRLMLVQAALSGEIERESL